MMEGSRSSRTTHAMRNIIVGTAGHIDHGKTALVGALTGIETDRLEEEKRRGISIDLGFAHLELGSKLRLGFVDVPGHERFVKNMLAGSVGVDVVLLIIAADESIKPQTREHFDICRLLGVKAGIVVLTKADLVDAEILELVRLEVEEFVAGSFLEGAPVVAVSSKTGQGIEDLKAALARVGEHVAEKTAAGWLRLPVDRSFSMRGFGTVVTGTLVSGSVQKEDDVEVQPGGRRLRVRSVQVHGKAEAKAVAGQRTALNLAGAEAAELRRGLTITAAGVLRATGTIDCELDLLGSAKPLKHNAPVHFHAGTADVEAQVKLLDPKDKLQPGSRGLVRLLLGEPILLLPGDRFIIRMFSPVVTIGGGRVIDIDPPAKQRRTAAAERAAKLAEAGPWERVAQLVKEAGAAIAITELMARTGLMPGALQPIVMNPQFVTIGEPAALVMDRSQAEATLKRIHDRVAAFHRANPLLPGISKEELRGRELEGAPAGVLDVLFTMSKTLVAEGDTVRLVSHKVRLQQDEEEALARIEGAFREAGLTVPTVPEVLAKSGVEPARAKGILQMLIRQRRLVKVSEDLVFHPDAIGALRGLLAGRKGMRFQVGEFKDWTGVSRKYAIPLLEYLDREHITRREGDQRVVL